MYKKIKITQQKKCKRKTRGTQDQHVAAKTTSKRYLPVFPGQLFQAILQYIIEDPESVVATQLYYIQNPNLYWYPIFWWRLLSTKQGILIKFIINVYVLWIWLVNFSTTTKTVKDYYGKHLFT